MNVPYYNYHFPYNSSALTTLLELKTTVKGNIEYASLFKQQGTVQQYFECVLVGHNDRLYTLPMATFVKII